MTILKYSEITKLIPHRFPMLLLDELEVTETGEKGKGLKNVTVNEPFFVGHFPEKPIMPGVLIVEALAQAAGTLVMHSLTVSDEAIQADKALVYFMSIENTRFIKPVEPGHQLTLHVEKIQSRGMVWKFKGEAKVDDTLVTYSEFKAMIALNKG